MPLPRIIHRIWIGSPLTLEQISCLADAHRHIPHDVQLWLWTTRPSMSGLNCKNIIVRNLNTLWPQLVNTPLPLAHLHSAFAREASGGTFHNYAAVSDIARLLILYLYGGIYLDMDVLFSQHAADLFHSLTHIGQRLGLLHFHLGSYGNGVLASMPRTDAVAMCLNKISELYTSGASSLLSWDTKRHYSDIRMRLTMIMSGPLLIIRTLEEIGLLLPINETQFFQPIDTSGVSYKKYPGRQRRDSCP